VVFASRPHAGTQAVQRLVGNLDGVVEVVERGYRHDRPEDLLLEDAHRVVALEDRRLSQVSATATASRLSWIRSAILLRMSARAATEVRPHAAIEVG
jgi:hypothetical protein